MLDNRLGQREQRQYEMEVMAVKNGVARFRSILVSRGSESMVGRMFLKRFFAPIARSIQRERQRIGEARDHAEKYTIPLLLLRSPDDLAYITLQGVLENIGLLEVNDQEDSDTLSGKETKVAREIGQRCWLEFALERSIRDETERSELEERIHEVTENRYPRRTARRLARRRIRHLNREEWVDKNYDVHLGLLLLKVAQQEGLIKRACKTAQKKRVWVIRLSDDAQRWMAKVRNYYEALASPVYMPMIVPPSSWDDLHSGGYLSNRATHATFLVKHKSWNKRQVLQTFQDSQLGQVVRAIDALQGTGWQVNRDVLRELKRIVKQRNALPGLSPIMKLKPKLPWGHHDYERRKQENYCISNRNRRYRRYRDFIIPLRIKICEELLDETLYFPYQLDFRGRAYPMPQLFHPQSDDLGRSLLVFAEGKPLGEQGEYWLKIHLANTYGKDKDSFEERVSWVDSNEDQILQCAKDPLITTFWRDPAVKRPWCFLAACIEWANCRSNGAHFESHLPVAMDGTCNGLQHLSAMMRDVEGGQATNLVPGNKPQDIYQNVANELYAIVNQDFRSEVSEAIDWVRSGEFITTAGIDRKLAKNATMTTPYGITRNGIAKYLRDEDFTKGLEKPWKGSAYLAQRLEIAIGRVIKKGKNLMVWMQQIARKLAIANEGVRWVSPLGFPVMVEYRKPIESRVRFEGRRHTVYRENVKGRIVAGKQAKTIVANFVHSFDASHMMLTVSELFKRGLRSFAMIHDSYAVHACDVPLMNEVLRKTFVQIYRLPILNQFLHDLRVAHPYVNLEEPPPQGDLDIKTVVDSNYFFS